MEASETGAEKPKNNDCYIGDFNASREKCKSCYFYVKCWKITERYKKKFKLRGYGWQKEGKQTTTSSITKNAEEK